MRKVFVIINALFLFMSSYAQDTTKQKNRISFSHGFILNKTEQYSPVFDFAYHITIWNNFRYGIAFQTYLYHHQTHYEEPSDKSEFWYRPDIISNCIFFELGYDISLLRKFSIYPYLRVGSNNCKVKYYMKNDTSDCLKQKNTIPTFITGISTIYKIQRFSFALSYDYSVNIRKTEQIFTGPFFDCEARPNRSFDFKHSALKIGINYNF